MRPEPPESDGHCEVRLTVAERTISQRSLMRSPASDVGDLLVSVAGKVLDGDRYSFLVDAGDHFDVVATSGREGTGRTYPRGMGIPSRAYDTGTACVIGDCLDLRGASAAEPTSSATAAQMRSLCCVPVGSVGLLLAEAVRPDAFEEIEKEVLVRFVDTVLDSACADVAPVRPVEDGGGRFDENADRIERIADILSHDLRNPLNVATGNIELAMETGEETCLQQAIDALDRVQELLDEVVHLARTGDLVEDPRPVDLETALRTAWDDLKTPQATLEVVGSASLTADERALRHLLRNLIDNAVIHAGPDVTIRVGPTDQGFFVEDDGPGIPADQRERVLDRGVSLGRESTGLGLYIVRRIAEAHGWQVTVSESGSGGARFEIEMHTGHMGIDGNLP